MTLMIVFVLLLVSLPVLTDLVVQSMYLCSIDTHALAVPGTCKYIAVQVMTGLAHIMSAGST